jgi:hypothetical protein
MTPIYRFLRRLIATPCDWDHDSYCTHEGPLGPCQRAATHYQFHGVTEEGDEIAVMVCCRHSRQGHP